MGRHSTQEPIERFRQKFQVTPEGCWVWTASRMGTSYGRTGYGCFFARGYLHYAHRWSYEHAHGRIPDDLEIDHLCNNTLCVNPEHLEAVTHRENIRRYHATRAS